MNIYWSFSVWLHRETFYVFIHVWIVSIAQYYTTCLCQMSLLCVWHLRLLWVQRQYQLSRSWYSLPHSAFQESNPVNTMRYKSSSWTESQSAQSSTRKKKLKQTPVQCPPVSLVQVKMREGSPSGTTNRLWEKDCQQMNFGVKRPREW